MASASNYSSSYGKALLAATSDSQRERSARRSEPAVITSADLALTENYGDSALNRRELSALKII
jgi:DNA-binding IclR family transcriptional regulator